MRTLSFDFAAMQIQWKKEFGQVVDFVSCSDLSYVRLLVAEIPQLIEALQQVERKAIRWQKAQEKKQEAEERAELKRLKAKYEGRSVK